MLRKIWPRLAALTLGLIILFVSMARASLVLIAQEGGTESLKNKEILFKINFLSGDTIDSKYKFPEVGTLPDNPMYGFKRIRDYFWLYFSQGEEKVKVSLLMADKNIVEFTELTNREKYDLAIDSGNEGLDKLEYAYGLVNNLKKTDTQAKKLYQQVFMVGFAYKEVFRLAEKSYSFEAEKYSKLISRINDWNKEQEKNRYTWDF